MFFKPNIYVLTTFLNNTYKYEHLHKDKSRLYSIAIDRLH